MRRDEFRSDIRTQNPQRVRIEGERYSFGAGCSGTLHNFPQDFLVTAMHAIKITDAHDGGAEIAGHFFDRAKDPHAISNSSLRPSCARRTRSGSVLLVSSWGRLLEMWVKYGRLGLRSSISGNECATVKC